MRTPRRGWTLLAAMSTLLLLPATAAPVQAAPPSSPPPDSLVVYPLPTSGVQPYDLTVGPDGNLWSPYNFASTLARITPAGDATEFPVSFLVFPRITKGADGNLWMLDLGSNSIDKISPDGVLLASYPFFGAGGVGDITKGPDGNVWFTEINSGQIGRVTPEGVLTEFDTPSGPGGALDIVTGFDGNLWYTDASAAKVGRITPTGAITLFDLPVIAGVEPEGPEQITRGPDGNLWYAKYNTGVIGRISTSGEVREFVLPVDSHPAQITKGPDGNLWYTDWNNDQIGRITTDGKVGTFGTTGQFYGGNIITGPDGRLWFTLGGQGSVAAFEPFRPDPSPPDIRSVSPRYTSPAGGTRVVITGYDVGRATQVLFGNTPAKSFRALGPSQVVAVAPPHAPAQVEIRVVTPGGTTAVSPATDFFYQSSACGTVVTRDTTLSADLGPCYTEGVAVKADNITLDLGGKRIFGFAPPSDGGAVGVRLDDRSGVTVRNGTVSGFDAGIVVRRGKANTLTALKVTDNVGPDDPFGAQFGDGIFIQNSPDNRVVANVVSHNGIFDGVGVFGPASNGTVVADNVVEDTVGPSPTGPSGQGIIFNGASGVGKSTFIEGGRVERNIVRHNASAGISNINHVGGAVIENAVDGNGTTNSFGNGIGISVGFSWNRGQTEMLVQGNDVHHNGVDGIRIGDIFGSGQGAPKGNTIIDNDAADNNANPAANTYEGGREGFDLHDLNEDCDNNVWRRNIWGSGGYAPPCTTTDGSGPLPPSTDAAVGTKASSVPPNIEAWQRFFDEGRS